ncbi:acyl-CoA N-acyltransferase [Xylaria digitata]|nr:acyl-CoA N-acyltransferase [Xylaria digitata]
MFTVARSGLQENLKQQNFVYVKAVDEQGTIIGHVGWVFSGASQRRAPSRGTSDEKKAAGDGQVAEPDKLEGGGEAEEDPIERLHFLEEADVQYWLQNLAPKDTSCMFVVGLTVSPSYQGRGIGSALLRHGNVIAEERGLSIWVHSSHKAYAAFRKAGFETRRELRINLDDYAPRAPRDGEPTMAEKHDGRWGEYVIRYMERKPSGK